ncbi:VanZ family protein [candidate division KSB1 bacterium]
MADSRVRSFLNQAWLWAVLYAVLIFLLSSLPGKIAPGPVFRFDLLLHFLEFAFFGFLLARTVLADVSRVSLVGCLLVILIGLAYAGLDEWHQSFVPGRLMELSDFLADGAGILIGVGAQIWLMKIKR